MRLILSLCDYSGAWSRPYVGPGYKVIRVDPKHGGVDQGGRGMTAGAVGEFRLIPMDDGGWALPMTVGALIPHLDELGPIWGVMAAPPCTDFANSGSRHWARKDAEGLTDVSVQIVRDCLTVAERAQAWWVLEQPVGRIRWFVPELGKPNTYFDPCDFAGRADDPEAEAYTKKTCLYGSFNPNLRRDRREPVRVCAQGSWVQKLGGSSERTKELRSKTPEGFARAFREANP
jgi:hypothetical protein